MSGNNKKVANRNSREYFAVFSEDLREKLNEQCFKVKRKVKRGKKTLNSDLWFILKTCLQVGSPI